MGAINEGLLRERVISLIPTKHGGVKEFAEKIGVPANLVSMWKKGDSKSYKNYLYQIAVAGNVSIDWLMGNEQEKKPTPPEEGELDASLIGRLIQLTPEELEKVDAFVQGLLAAR